MTDAKCFRGCLLSIQEAFLGFGENIESLYFRLVEPVAFRRKPWDGESQGLFS